MFPTDKHLYRTEVYRVSREGLPTIVELTVWIRAGVQKADLFVREVDSKKFQMNDARLAERYSDGKLARTATNQRPMAALQRMTADARSLRAMRDAELVTACGYSSIDEFVRGIGAKLFDQAEQARQAHRLSRAAAAAARWMPPGAGWF